MIFRRIKEKDTPKVKEMVYNLYNEDPEGKPISEEKILRTIKHLFRYPGKGCLYVFEEGTTSVGYALVIFYWSNEYGGDIIHIDELYVQPKYRQRGIATGFLHHITGAFKSGVALQLEVTPSNEKANSYYKRLGFCKTRNRHLIKEI